MSGPKMTPLFHDNIRPQIIVDLMACGAPLAQVRMEMLLHSFT